MMDAVRRVQKDHVSRFLKTQLRAFHKQATGARSFTSPVAQFREKKALARASVRTGGDAKLKYLRELLHNGFGFTRSKDQIKFHENFIRASIHHIYGDEFAEKETEIMQRNNYEDTNQQILICTPRRWGA